MTASEPDGRVSGSRTVTVVPTSSTDSMPSVPPWRSTIVCTMRSPSPVPAISDRVALEARKKREPRPSRSAAGMPMPSSTTSSIASRPTGATRTSTTSPGSENFTALETRLVSARKSWVRSPSTITGEALWMVRRVMVREAAVSRRSPTTSAATPAGRAPRA